jgi:hypothetical protein
MADPNSEMSGDEILRLLEDVVMASDRAFFLQQPHRRFRLRPAWDIELKDIAYHTGEPLPTLPAGLCWWVAVHNYAPGLRGRFPFAAPHNLPTETSEETASEIFRRVTERT